MDKEIRTDTGLVRILRRRTEAEIALDRPKKLADVTQGDRVQVS